MYRSARRVGVKSRSQCNERTHSLRYGCMIEDALSNTFQQQMIEVEWFNVFLAISIA